jgi:hypothetical protein
MTSHQPGTTVPVTMSEVETPDAGPRAAPGQAWTQVLPLTLLIVLGLAGLRGAVTAPRWNGPLLHDGTVVGLALEVIPGVLLAATIRRRVKASRAALPGRVPVSDVVTKLRGVLIAAP